MAQEIFSQLGVLESRSNGGYLHLRPHGFHLASFQSGQFADICHVANTEESKMTITDAFESLIQNWPKQDSTKILSKPRVLFVAISSHRFTVPTGYSLDVNSRRSTAVQTPFSFPGILGPVDLSNCHLQHLKANLGDLPVIMVQDEAKTTQLLCWGSISCKLYYLRCF